MSVVIRAADPEHDFAAVARLLARVEPEPESEEDLLEDAQRVVPGKLRRRFVATVGDELAGYAVAVHYPSQGHGKFHVHVVVDPEHERRGIGSELYERALAFACEHSATVVHCEVQERRPHALEFAKRRGFRLHVHEVGATLDLARFDERPFTPVLDGVRGRGIHITSLAEEGVSPENERRLYAINRTASLDNPSSDGTFPEFDVWRTLILEASDFQPDGQLIALDTRRADSAYVALSAIAYVPETNTATTLLTGVDPAYRRQRVAFALKLHAIRFARAHGAAAITTRINARNASMLALNDRLGFMREPGFYELVRTLE